MQKEDKNCTFILAFKKILAFLYMVLFVNVVYTVIGIALALLLGKIGNFLLISMFLNIRHDTVQSFSVTVSAFCTYSLLIWSLEKIFRNTDVSKPLFIYGILGIIVNIASMIISALSKDSSGYMYGSICLIILHIMFIRASMVGDVYVEENHVLNSNPKSQLSTTIHKKINFLKRPVSPLTVALLVASLLLCISTVALWHQLRVSQSELTASQNKADEYVQKYKDSVKKYKEAQINNKEAVDELKKEIQKNYEQGYDDGNDSGTYSGYNEGYDDGYEDGFYRGYDACYYGE